MSGRSERVVVVGAGGFGRETLDVVQALEREAPGGIELLGVLDARPSAINLRRLCDRGVRYLGDDDAWLREPLAPLFVVAIGDPQVRAEVASRYLLASLTPLTLVHPSVRIGKGTSLGRGSIVCAGAFVSSNTQTGDFVTMNPGVTIGQYARLGNYVSVNPGAVVGSDVDIEDGVLIGAGAVVLEGCKLGQGSIIGASACVSQNVPSGTVVKGVPAR